ncbi:protein phosphatase 1 regulatory subunit 16A-like isoform X1 [Branchiostoma floridae]|uniref:Protein phosphatase 1 regulatory subunit 16A-like isoform X1 n=1 Tax=Branchiostoma floridae TaxID=7739 RepID=A0A9J7MUJ0_BRAFL|nr:protein phosphatase 1 regulatory subunit 16A-like isoform X1 [Branchiostoma floridae]
MADHMELVAEMPLLERLSASDRLAHAKKRRTQQLKQWVHRQKELDKKSKKRKDVPKQEKTSKKRLKFVDTVTLLDSAARDDVHEVAELLKSGVSPDMTNSDGLTPLHQCCIEGSEEMMKVLVEAGANVNAVDCELWTPLHAAATCGHINLVRYLINNGADVLAVNADGNMPYDICEDETALDYIESVMAQKGVTQDQIERLRGGREQAMLDDLRDRANQGMDLEFTDKEGASPLHIASANGYERVAEFLLDHHVSVDIRDKDGWQPIHAAAYWSQPELVDLLLSNGADLDAKTNWGETPIEVTEDENIRKRLEEWKTKAAARKAQDRWRAAMRKNSSASTSRRKRPHSLLAGGRPCDEFSAMRKSSVREREEMMRRESRGEGKALLARVEDQDAVDTRLEETNIDDVTVNMEAGPGVPTVTVTEPEDSPNTAPTPDTQSAPHRTEPSHTSSDKPSSPARAVTPAVPTTGVTPGTNTASTNTVSTATVAVTPPGDAVQPAETANTAPPASQNRVVLDENKENREGDRSRNGNRDSALRSMLDAFKSDRYQLVSGKPKSNGAPQTLAELKRQRALALRQQLSSTFSNEGNSNSSDQGSRTPSQNGGDNTAYPYINTTGSLDPPMQRFKSPVQEVVGTRKTSCCVVM